MDSSSKTCENKSESVKDDIVNQADNQTSLASVTINKNDGHNCTEFQSDKLLGMRLVNETPYFLVRSGNKTSLHSIVTARSHAGKFILDQKKLYKEYRENMNKEAEETRYKLKYEGANSKYLTSEDHYRYQGMNDLKVHEVMVDENGSYMYLKGYRNHYIPPEWVPMSELAGVQIEYLIRTVDKQYKRTLG